MPKNSNIKKIRDGALSMTVGDGSDGAIRFLVSVDDVDLYAVKDKAIFKIVLADKIDPARTNASVPNTNQKIVSAGCTSEIVARTFLTVDGLVNSVHFDSARKRKPFIDASIEVMRELLSAGTIRDEISEAETEAFEELNQPANRSFAMPSVEHLREQVKTFVQRIEHASQATYRMTQLLYDHDKKFFDGFAEKMELLYGLDDEFAKFSRELAIQMKFVRNLRHCIEHEKPTQKLVVEDFRLNRENKLLPPMIEIIHDETPQKVMRLSDFLHQVLEGNLTSFEVLLVFITSKHMKPMKGFNLAVGNIPLDQRRKDSKVRFGYLLEIGGNWRKLG